MKYFQGLQAPSAKMFVKTPFCHQKQILLKKLRANLANQQHYCGQALYVYI